MNNFYKRTESRFQKKHQQFLDTGLSYSPMYTLCNLPMDQWTYGPMDQWTNGPIDQWTNGPMDGPLWTNGPLD